MKSIKEKAEENCIKYGNLGNVAYQEFVEGANYVLGEVECIFENKELDCEERCNELIALVEQLKK